MSHISKVLDKKRPCLSLDKAFLNIYFLSKKTIENKKQRLLLYILANLFVFSLIQFETWFVGFNFLMLIPIACITGGILVGYSDLNYNWKLFIGIVLSTISTFTFSHGLIAWILIFPVLALSKSRKEFVESKLRTSLIWLIGFVLTLRIYFFDYQKPFYQPDTSYMFHHPIQAIQYFLSYIGSPIGQVSYAGRDFIAPLIGLVLLLIFASIFTYFIFSYKDFRLSKKLIGWLMIGSYTIITAVLTVYGRAALGIEQSFASRYTSVSTYLIISLIYLLVILFNNFKTPKGRNFFKSAPKKAASFMRREEI